MQRPLPPPMPHMLAPDANAPSQKPVPILLCLLVFIIGATSRYDLTLIARVPVSELLAFASIPFLLNAKAITRCQKRLPIVIFFLGLWAVGILLSDVFNYFIFMRFIRAIAKPVFCTLWMLFFVGALLRDFRILVWFPVGGVIASLQNYFFPQEWTEEYLETGGYEAAAYGFTPIVVSIGLAAAVLLYRKSRLYAVIAFGLTAVGLGIVGAPRSSMAMMLLNAVLIGYIWFTRQPHRRAYQLTPWRLIGLGVLLLIASYGLFELYVWMATNGYLGELQEQKLANQEQTIFGQSPLGLILAGRTPVFAAVLAILDKPFLGFGSWSGITLGDYFVDAIFYVGTDTQLMERVSGATSHMGAGHSIFFQGWMENGILTAISMLWIAYIALRVFLQTIRSDHRLAPWIIYLVTAFCWAFLFSPFGVGSRMQIGFFLALYITAFFDWRPRRL